MVDEAERTAAQFFFLQSVIDDQLGRDFVALVEQDSEEFVFFRALLNEIREDIRPNKVHLTVLRYLLRHSPINIPVDLTVDICLCLCQKLDPRVFYFAEETLPSVEWIASAFEAALIRLLESSLEFRAISDLVDFFRRILQILAGCSHRPSAMMGRELLHFMADLVRNEPTDIAKTRKFMQLQWAAHRQFVLVASGLPNEVHGALEDNLLRVIEAVGPPGYPIDAITMFNHALDHCTRVWKTATADETATPAPPGGRFVATVGLVRCCVFHFIATDRDEALHAISSLFAALPSEELYFCILRELALVVSYATPRQAALLLAVLERMFGGKDGFGPDVSTAQRAAVLRLIALIARSGHHQAVEKLRYLSAAVDPQALPLGVEISTLASSTVSASPLISCGPTPRRVRYPVIEAFEPSPSRLLDKAHSQRAHWAELLSIQRALPSSVPRLARLPLCEVLEIQRRDLKQSARLRSHPQAPHLYLSLSSIGTRGPVAPTNPATATPIAIATTTSAESAEHAVWTFLRSERKVLVVQGCAGAGKTLLLQRLHRELLDTYCAARHGRIPLWIDQRSQEVPLRVAVAESLRAQGFCASHIEELRQNHVVFLIDAIDEVHVPSVDSVYHGNKLWLWPSAKVIFATRGEGCGRATDRAAGGTALDTRPFMPFLSEHGHAAQPQLLQELLLLPLTLQQRANFLDVFLSEERTRRAAISVAGYVDDVWTPQMAEQAITSTTGAESMARNPLSLSLLVEALPELRGLVPINETLLLEQFVDRWVRSRALAMGLDLAESGPDVHALDEAWAYSMALAAEMERQHVTAVRFCHVGGSAGTLRSQVWSRFFEGQSPRTERCRQLAPLVRGLDGSCAFPHVRVQMFLSARFALLELRLLGPPPAAAPRVPED